VGEVGLRLLRMGIDRFDFNSCALVVVGSKRESTRIFSLDGFDDNPRRLGVDGTLGPPEAVVGVGMLEMEDWAERLSNRDLARLTN
jgi:hypothetical protein